MPTQAANRPYRQMDVATARKILGLIERNYSDVQLVEALECLYVLAEIGHELMREGRSASD